MVSYQDIDVRLKVIEDKVEFLLNAVRISQPSPIIGYPPRVFSLKDLYLESKAAGLMIEENKNGGDAVPADDDAR